VYQAERAAMCHIAGQLVDVRYGTPHDAPTLLTTILLDFETGSWVLAVNAGDDTVQITDTDATSLRDLYLAEPAAHSPWTAALGSAAQWVWILENQQGYADGIQFAFAHDGAQTCQIQLIAAASCWQIGVIRPPDGPTTAQGLTLATQ
jgi:hypothetical protein